MLSSAAGNDLLFDESLCQQGKNFTNKLWNALRLVDGWDTDFQIKQPKVNELAINWYRNKFNNTLESIDGNFENYRISDVLMSSYKLIWDDFCSWLLEILKPEYGQKIDQKSKSELIELFIKNLKIIHPFMPFLSEEIYHNLNDKVSQPITISSWPSKEEYDIQLINNFEITKEIISQIRNYRKEKIFLLKHQLNYTAFHLINQLVILMLLKKLDLLRI